MNKRKAFLFFNQNKKTRPIKKTHNVFTNLIMIKLGQILRKKAIIAGYSNECPLKIFIFLMPLRLLATLIYS